VEKTGVASNTLAVNKHDEMYSLENVSTDWKITISAVWELGRRRCRVDSAGSRRILLNTTVEVQVTVKGWELQTHLSGHPLLKLQTAPWTYLIRRSLPLPPNVLLFLCFQLMAGLWWNSGGHIWFHVIKWTDFPLH
jgi:hypothetical protein